MKNRLFYGVASVLLLASLISGCTAEGEDVLLPGSASVLIDDMMSDDPTVLKVRMTPSQDAVSFRYGIGNNEDLVLFETGTFEEEVTVEGNEPVEITFDEVDSQTEYLVFAQAFSSDGVAGRIFVHRVVTEDSSFDAGIQYLTDRSAGVELSLSNNYYMCEYYLGTASDRDAFRNGELETSGLEENTAKRFVLNFFGLEPETEYVFYMRGYDRKGIVGQYRELPFKTVASGECPDVNMEISHIDIYRGEFKLTANDMCGSFSAFVCQKGVNDNVINNDMNWKGDMIEMFSAWEGIGDAVFCKEKTLEMDYTINSLANDYELEMYVMVYDTNYEPFGVYHYEFSTPSYNENAEKGSVTIEVSDITEVGATYTYKASDNLFAFMFETVDADWYDEIKKSSDWNETYLHQTLFNGGQYFAYCRDMKDGTLVYKEETGQGNYRYYAAACPMTENGTRGWLPEVLVEYVTK